MALDKARFLNVVDATPLVSIDLVVRDPSGRVLLGKRVNRPAQGFWFVPGGRIWKNERVRDAFARIAKAELGCRIAAASFLGVYDHIYPDNFYGQDGINTHYVVLAVLCHWPEGAQLKRDQQHSEMRWWTVCDLLADPAVHANSKRYFEPESAPDAFRPGEGAAGG